MSALAGVRVVEFAEGWCGAAIAGRLLAELGATVIKIELPEGDPLRGRSPQVDGQSFAFRLLAAGKDSVVLDYVRDADEAGLLRDIVSTVDVVLDGLPRGLLDTLRLGAADARACNASIIWCDVSTFGSDGPLATWAGGELAAQALSGLMTTTGFAEDPPTSAGFPLSEHAAALFAVTGILAALFHRTNCAQGQDIDIAGADCLASFLSSFLPPVFIGVDVPRRQGFRHPLMAPWDVYDASDGKVVICAGHDAHWNAILRMIGRPELIGDDRYEELAKRVARVEEVNSLIQAWIGRRTAGDAIAALREAGIPAGPILNLRQVFDHPHFEARRMAVADPAGDGALTVGTFYKMSRTPGRVPRAASVLGAGNREHLGARRAAVQVSA